MDKLENIASESSLETDGNLSIDEKDYLAVVSSAEYSCFSCNVEPCRACYGSHVF